MIDQIHMQNHTAKKSFPKYREVEEDLRYKILFGYWKPGDQILTEEELCKIYNVSRITVRKAIHELEIAGYLVSQSGKGTFVTGWQENQPDRPILKSFTNEMHELGNKGHHDRCGAFRDPSRQDHGWNSQYPCWSPDHPVETCSSNRRRGDHRLFDQCLHIHAGFFNEPG